jgi:DNA-directed RNA polymerase subunit RPC12/RpoP/predicted RNA methylase
MSNPDDLTSFLARHARPYDAAADAYRRPPFAAPVKATKATPIYNAHSYHTKVPPQGIVPYMLHYTEPGDLVLDPFCGSGMTGVAALMCAHPPAEALHMVPGAQAGARCAILSDLSPAATHIAYNYCTPVDVEALKREFERIQAAVKEEFDWLYGTTCERCGGRATIQYTIWSDVFECARCGKELVLWDVALDRQSGKVHETFTCPTCGKEQIKKGLRRVGSVPVVTNYECHGDCKPRRAERPATEAEKQHIAEIEAAEIPYWHPTDEFPLGRQTRKIRHGTAGISHVDQMYTKRNLWALARLWHEAGQISDARITSALRFGLTAINNYINKRQGYGTGGGGISGTLYVPSLVMEKNVGLIADRKITKLVQAFTTMPHALVTVVTGDATQLSGIPDSVIDYVFTDPPFGFNLQYAELNFLWESWLKQFTDWSQDCVMNYVHGKDLGFYSDTMARAFAEMCRVLKPGRWASVVFHNTNDAVWRAIQEGAQGAGFDVVNAMAFDKSQGTFNQVNMGKDSAAGFDVVLNLYKPRREGTNGRATPIADVEAKVVEAVAMHLASNPPAEYRTIQFLHSFAIRQLLNSNILIEKVAIPYLETVLPHYFKQIEGRWYMRGEQVIEGGLGLIVKDEPSAIAWLARLLENEPQPTGDLIPQWQIATLEARVAKPLDQVLAENFWQDERSGRWRLPTAEERHRMSAQEEVAAQAQLRVVQRYLEGGLERRPSDLELCAWMRFCYSHGFYAEAAALFPQVDEARVGAEEYRSMRKIAEVCRLRVG